MQVTNITVNYGRKRQPAKYEESSAFIEFSGSLSDGVNPGEDHVAVATRLLGEVKTLVLTELGLIEPGQSASAVVIAANRAAEPVNGAANGTAVNGAGNGAATNGKPVEAKTTRGKAKTTAAAEPVVKAPPPGGPGENRISPDDLPEEHGQPSTGSQKATTVNLDLPDDSVSGPVATGSTGAVVVKLTNAEVQALVTTFIKDGKIDVKTVKSISTTFGAARIADIPEDKLGAYKAAIDKAVAEAGDQI